MSSSRLLPIIQGKFSIASLYTSGFSTRAFNFRQTVDLHIARVVGPYLIQSRPYNSDLKKRGLKSLEDSIDTRIGEHLKADVFEKKRVSLWRQRKPSVYAVINQHPELPAETQLQTRNRNPRNMELLGYNKPKGYGKLRKRRDFWNRMNLVISNNHITAYVDHHTGEILVSASTQEFSIARHLWRNTDVSAAINIGRVIAERCKECGIDRVFWRMKSEKRKEKVQAFMNALKEQGLRLTEPRRIVLPHYYTSDPADFKPKKKKRVFLTRAVKRKFT